MSTRAYTGGRKTIGGVRRLSRVANELRQEREQKELRRRSLQAKAPESKDLPLDIGQIWSSTFGSLFSTDSSIERRESLSQNELCDRFGIESKNVAARAKTYSQTTQQYLEERTGWQFNERERKYYPPP